MSPRLCSSYNPSTAALTYFDTSELGADVVECVQATRGGPTARFSFDVQHHEPTASSSTNRSTTGSTVGSTGGSTAAARRALMAWFGYPEMPDESFGGPSPLQAAANEVGPGGEWGRVRNVGGVGNRVLAGLFLHQVSGPSACFALLVVYCLVY